ncbi:hypothetical protein LSAT2_029758 [Lamellibrachia satsuma]|nr:hypothetical protein LSAT2_029758 [Lamellibrachia satsuma]
MIQWRSSDYTVKNIGGCVCIIMREEFLTDVSDYVDRLEPFTQQLAGQGAWTVVPRYWCPTTAATTLDKTGVVFVYRVKQSAAITVTSTQFTK